MIAIPEAAQEDEHRANWHAGFMVMMPAIVNYARHAFRHLNPEARTEAIQETLVSAMFAYRRLFQRGKVDLAYPSVLARFAVSQYRDGRRVGEKMNCRDVMSPYARRRNGIQLESLNAPGEHGEPWREVLVEDKHAGPADIAAARIDIDRWFSLLSGRDREIAEALSEGSTTNDLAKRFQVSPARISQKRRQFFESWQSMQGQLEA